MQRFLDLYDWAAGVRQLTVLAVGDVGQVEQQVAVTVVGLVADHVREAVDADGAELDRLVGHALRDLPYRRIVPGAGRDLIDQSGLLIGLHQLPEDFARLQI